MSISGRDKEFMSQVAAYFRSTKSPSSPDGSIRDTALKFDINRNKVRKILITMGELTSPITEQALSLRKQGMSIKEIAEAMSLSTATVSAALPYEDKIDNTLEPSEHASDVRSYRAYEKEQLKKQAGRELQEEIKRLEARAKELEAELEMLRGYVPRRYPKGLLRLHLEIFKEQMDQETTEILKKYGKLEYGDCISRDVIVPDDIQLYAVHYMIQRAFGWQNSHLRKFLLPEERFHAVTGGNAAGWKDMVGVLFRSPLMDETDEFWADDYEGGSFKNWIREKYTGPYHSYCEGEKADSCKKDMKKLDMNQEYYLLYAGSYNRKTEKYDGDEFLAVVSPVYDPFGNKRPEPEPWFSKHTPCRVEIVPFKDIPSEGLKYLFDAQDPQVLLERLPITSVLAEEGSPFSDHVSKKKTSPEPVTDVLFYNYDFGDSWEVRITAARSCQNLVEAGRITQADLDRAAKKCQKTYRPVMIARDGDMLLDDVGGIYGFADFLKRINPETEGLDEDEKAALEEEKEGLIWWARSLGWHRSRFTDYNLL